MNLTEEEINIVDYLLDEHIRDCKLKVEVFGRHLEYAENVKSYKNQIKICKNIRQKILFK